MRVCLMFQVSALCHLFTASRSDQQSKEVLGEITDYNKRYSGAPRRVSAPEKYYIFIFNIILFLIFMHCPVFFFFASLIMYIFPLWDK